MTVRGILWLLRQRRSAQYCVRGGSARSLALTCVALLLIVTGCSEDANEPCRPEVPSGRIEGTVRLGHQPISGIVRATRIPIGGQSEAVMDARPNTSTGAYALDVPAGRYVIAWNQVYEYSASGLRYGNLPPDTVLVDDPDRPLVVDFNLATLRAHLTLSSRLDGEYAYIRLYLKGALAAESRRSYVRDGGAEIVGGTADITILGILPGEYKVEVVIGKRVYACYCPYDGEHLWVPGVQDSSQSPWVEVQVNQAVDVSAEIDLEPARIEGKILGAWLQIGSFQAPTIALVEPDSTVVMGAREVAADGSFGVDIYLPRPVKILVEQEGIKQWIGGATFEEALTFELERGQTVSGIQFTQSGIRLDLAESSVLPENIRVRLFDADDGLVVAQWTPSIMPPGRVLRICNLRPGRYLMYLDPEYFFTTGWLPQWYDRVDSPESARTIVIENEGSVVQLPVVLERGGIIRGLVRDREESSSDFLIFVTRADDRAVWGRTFAFDPTPEFQIQGLPDGDWKVGAWRQPAAHQYPEEAPATTIWYPSTTDWEAAGIVSIQLSSEVTGIEINTTSH